MLFVVLTGTPKARIPVQTRELASDENQPCHWGERQWILYLHIMSSLLFWSGIVCHSMHILLLRCLMSLCSLPKVLWGCFTHRGKFSIIFCCYILVMLNLINDMWLHRCVFIGLPPHKTMQPCVCTSYISKLSFIFCYTSHGYGHHWLLPFYTTFNGLDLRW